MTFEIKLKAGFFKTRPYFLSISERQLILTPRELSEDGRVIVDWHELKSICIIRRDQAHAPELEIITCNNVIIGNFSLHSKLEEICQELAREFGEKFIGII